MELAISSYASDEIMCDPTAQKARTPSVSATNKSPSLHMASPSPDPRSAQEEEEDPVDLETRIGSVLQQMAANATSTKEDIRATFLELCSKITERELKLLHDVETTMDKKQRLLQTQLDYIKHELLHTLTTAG